MKAVVWLLLTPATVLTSISLTTREMVHETVSLLEMVQDSWRFLGRKKEDAVLV